MRVSIRSLTTLGVFAAASSAAAQAPAVRPLGAVAAKATETFVSPNVTLRAVPGGVLVNDIQARRVVLLDAALAKATVVADTTPATANAYSGRIGGLLPYKGDSTLFVDPQSLSMLVIDATGKVARVMSVPRSDDAMSLTGLGGGTPALDAAGRLVYRAAPNFRRMMAAGAPGGAPPMPQIPDSAALVRVDLGSRAVDTVGWFKTPAVKMNMSRTDDGRITMTSEVNPLPTVDDWAVLSDGTVALVRGRDYHIDFVDADGSRRTANKLPFEWQRLSDEQKVAFIDSVKVQRERQMAEMRANAPVQTGSAPTPAPMAGGGQMVIEMRQGPGRDGGPPPSNATRITAPTVNFVSPSELPDYRPAFFAGSARADLEGNLWIRTTSTKAGGGAIYDVVNRKGELVDRVQIPVNRSIASFGPQGAVYLVGREGTTTVVERASVK